MNSTNLPAVVMPHMADGGALSKIAKTFGRGWWWNHKNDIVKEIPHGDLGPHGDHDGWIGVTKNAKDMGIDPREAKAMQRATFGFYLPRQYASDYPDFVSSIGGNRPFVSPGLGAWDDDLEELFQKIYGMSTNEAQALPYEGSLRNLTRIRHWPTGNNVSIAVNNEEAIPKLGSLVDKIPGILGASKINVMAPDYSFTFTPENFSRINSDRSFRALGTKERYADGGQVKGRNGTSTSGTRGAVDDTVMMAGGGQVSALRRIAEMFGEHVADAVRRLNIAQARTGFEHHAAGSADVAPVLKTDRKQFEVVPSIGNHTIANSIALRTSKQNRQNSLYDLHSHPDQSVTPSDPDISSWSSNLYLRGYAPKGIGRVTHGIVAPTREASKQYQFTPALKDDALNYLLFDNLEGNSAGSLQDLIENAVRKPTTGTISKVRDMVENHPTTSANFHPSNGYSEASEIVNPYEMLRKLAIRRIAETNGGRFLMREVQPYGPEGFTDLGPVHDEAYKILNSKNGFGYAEGGQVDEDKWRNRGRALLNGTFLSFGPELIGLAAALPELRGGLGRYSNAIRDITEAERLNDKQYGDEHTGESILMNMLGGMATGSAMSSSMKRAGEALGRKALSSTATRGALAQTLSDVPGRLLASNAGQNAVFGGVSSAASGDPLDIGAGALMGVVGGAALGKAGTYIAPMLRRKAAEAPAYADGGQVVGALRRIAQRMMGEPSKKGVAEIVKGPNDQWFPGNPYNFRTNEGHFTRENLEKGFQFKNATEEQKARVLMHRNVPSYEHFVVRNSDDTGYDFITPQQHKRLLERTYVNDWMDSALKKYVKNRMGTEQDEIRKLAEQGIHHLQDDFGVRAIARENHLKRYAETTRKNLGTKAVAQSRKAKIWEDASDEALSNIDKAYHVQNEYNNPVGSKVESLAFANKLDPQTNLFRFNLKDDGHDLGFDHIQDYLRAAVSGELPPELSLNPKSLSKLSVEEAVKRTDKWNKWMDAKKAVEDAAKAENVSTQRLHEHPSGHNWVEFVLPDRNAVEDHDEALNALKTAMNYEGDQLNHCVGSYCDDVASGASRIFSLRDKNKKPLVTIEAEGSPEMLSKERLIQSGNRDIWEEYETAKADGEVPNLTLHEFIKKAYPDHWKDLSIPKIIQIRSNSNQPPPKELRPMIREFLDKQFPNGVEHHEPENAGLHLVNGKYFSDDDLVNKWRENKAFGLEGLDHVDAESIASELNRLVGNHPDELEDSAKAMLKAYLPDLPMYAEGGEVKQTRPYENTRARIIAGNAKLPQRMRIGGMNISIENERGSIRSDVHNDPPKWHSLMPAHYGYIRGTKGKDKDHVDVFVNHETPKDWDGDVYVVNQKKANGHFDEHKAMLGFDDEAHATRHYLAAYEPGWEKRIHSVAKMPLSKFRQWAFSDEPSKGLAEDPVDEHPMFKAIVEAANNHEFA